MLKRQFIKLKIGDPVRMKKGLETGKIYGYLPLYIDMKFEGVRVVKEIEGRGVKVRGSMYWYSYPMLEIVK